ncbi:MAG: cysteine desulfurase/selenocysteine lyase [Gammaproteobacteria bacterium]|jgi:cysteine desulfurase/selenocysteine lyase
MDIREKLMNNVAFPLVERYSQTRCWSIADARLTTHRNPNLNQQQIREKLKTLLETTQSVNFWKAHYHHVDFDAALAKSSIHEILESLPITYKTQYIQNFPENVITTVREAEHQTLSSGGTNERMTVMTDFAKRDSLRALENVNVSLSQNAKCAKKTLDIPPSACNVTCGLTDQGPENVFSFLKYATKHKQWQHKDTLGSLRGRIERQWIMRRETVTPFTAGDWEHLCQQIDPVLVTLRTQKVQVLRGYPLFIYWIALRAQETNTQLPHLNVVVPYGGLAGNKMIDTITRLLNVSFVNLYGTGEVGSIGASKKEQHDIAIYEQDVIVEIIDDNGEPIRQNNVNGNLVITDLDNLSMPIVRYSFGDVGCWTQQPDGIKTLLVQGRKVETLLSENAEPMQARELQNAILSDENITNFLMVKKSDNAFELQLSVRAPISTRFIFHWLQGRLGSNTDITITITPFLSPAASGKYLGFSDMYTGNVAKHVNGHQNSFTSQDLKTIDSESLRQHFPLLNRNTPTGDLICYLDNAATSPKPSCVIDAVSEVLSSQTSNVHRGAHFIGDEITERFENARASIAKFIGANPSEIILLRNNTECLNFIAQQPIVDNVVTSESEHHANYLPWKKKSCLPLDDKGRVKFETLGELLKNKPNSLISLAHISNVTGNMIDVEKVVAIAKQYGAKVMIDAAQSAPHMPLDVQQLGVDYLTFSGHKVGGPSGVGVLWVNPNIIASLVPVQWGGSMMESILKGKVSLKPTPWCFEAGTPAIESVVGLGAAVEWLMALGMDNVQSHVHDLTRYARQQCIENFGDVVIGSQDAPGPVSLNVTSYEPHFLATLLSERYSICVRAGFHCAQPLHQALNSKGTLRISPWLMNNKADIDRCINAIKNAVSQPL